MAPWLLSVAVWSALDALLAGLSDRPVDAAAVMTTLVAVVVSLAILVTVSATALTTIAVRSAWLYDVFAAGVSAVDVTHAQALSPVDLSVGLLLPGRRRGRRWWLHS